MDKQNLSAVQSTDVGDLGIFHLKRIWASALLGKQVNDPYEGDMNKSVLDGLELSIIETLSFLYQQKPAFPEFEKWVLEKHGGFIDDSIREKINRAMADRLAGRHKNYPITLETDDPVFDSRDWACWEENGYIVLKEAVPREDCEALEEAIWEYLKLRPNEPETWKMRNEAFWVHGFRHPLLGKNRRSRRIHRAFAQLWGTEELFHSVDRLSFNPPMGEEHQQFGPSNLHWDASIVQPQPFDILGIMYLNDVRPNQGAFQCVPGFHRRIESWLDGLPPDADPRREILDAFEPVKIGGKAGDLIIWRQELPHGSSVNRADYPRFAQYMAMYPADRTINPVWK